MLELPDDGLHFEPCLGGESTEVRQTAGAGLVPSPSGQRHHGMAPSGQRAIRISTRTSNSQMGRPRVTDRKAVLVRMYPSGSHRYGMDV